jgi:hypothetical protein
MIKFATGLFSLAVSVNIVFAGHAAAAEPSWSPVIIATGEYRDQIKSMPIEERPYRPLHFYGNTVRRNHYRGNPVPMPQDIGTTGGQWMRRR